MQMMNTPTIRYLEETTTASVTHYIAAATLFVILAYFCFVPFRENTKGKKGKKGRRSKIYYVCGWVMVAAMLGVLVSNFALSAEQNESLRTVYWAETVALCAFGVAWMVAGKWVWFLVDEEEALHLFGDRGVRSGSGPFPLIRSRK